MVNKNKLHGPNGFSLIEVSIVITIMGLVLAPLFNYMTKRSLQKRIFKEEAVNEQVLASIALYLKENGTYPCPADSTLAIGSPGFGVADCASLATIGFGLPASQVLVGALPTNALNLPARTAMNTNNWKYIYAVSENLTDIASYNGVGQISIVDDSNVQFTARLAHFTIVNPGQDGKGARSRNGVLSGVGCNTALDTENCNGDATFLDGTFSLGGGPTSATYYDDSISYTLSRKESTFWLVRESTSLATSSGLDIVNRNIGNVGIGTVTPTDKLHVSGGDVRVSSSGGNGGNITVDNDVNAAKDITAGNEVRADTRVVSPIFYYAPPPP